MLDLFCGLGGWSQSFIEQGYRAVGIDIEAHDYGSGGYPGELILRDIRSVSGTELVASYGVPSIIVASPPCQEFSYMAMPWSKAKEKMAKILSDPAEQQRLTQLFRECFRVQREISDAAGHYVPIIIENVRGAQRWVGRARWNFGSFYLWGDVPALMPITMTRRMKSKISCSPRQFSDRIASTPEEAHALHYKLPNGDGTKLPGNNGPRRWDEREVKRRCDATKVPSERGRCTDVGNGTRFTSRDCGIEGVKQMSGLHGLSHPDGNGSRDLGGPNDPRRFSSRSMSRKAASATIAKIPPALGEWIARCFKTP